MNGDFLFPSDLSPLMSRGAGRDVDGEGEVRKIGSSRGHLRRRGWARAAGPL